MCSLRKLCLLIAVLLSPVPGLADVPGTTSCERLIAQGQELVDQRPVQHRGDNDEHGRPITSKAQIHHDLTDRAVAFWERASRICLKSAERAGNASEAARLISLAYWAQGQALELNLQYDDACNAFRAGTAAVEEMDGERSRHLIRLNDLVAFCAHSQHADPNAMVRGFEKSLEIRIETYGPRDPRIVEGLTQLAVAIPYAVSDGGDLSKAQAREAAATKSRVERLYQLAIEIVEEHPTSPEIVKTAVAQYCGWLIREQRMDECQPLRQLEERILQLNKPDSSR